MVECSLGGDGYRAPATLLSDKRVICNVSSHVAGEQKLGLVFAGMLQACAALSGLVLSDSVTHAPCSKCMCFF